MVRTIKIKTGNSPFFIYKDVIQIESPRQDQEEGEQGGRKLGTI